MWGSLKFEKGEDEDEDEDTGGRSGFVTLPASLQDAVTRRRYKKSSIQYPASNVLDNTFEKCYIYLGNKRE